MENEKPTVIGGMPVGDQISEADIERFLDIVEPLRRDDQPYVKYNFRVNPPQAHWNRARMQRECEAARIPTGTFG